MASEKDEATYPCPACGEKLYGWVAARHPLDGTKLVLDRCENCGLVVTRAPEPPEVEWEMGVLTRTPDEVVAPNRRSFQGGIGGAQWADLEPGRRRLHLTPDSAERLLAAGGERVERTRTPFSRRGYLGMVQTLINGFTLRDNFLRNARAGLMRPATTRERLGFGLDLLVSVLIAVPLALVALPIELLGSLLGRGGEMRLRVRPDAR